MSDNQRALNELLKLQKAFQDCIKSDPIRLNTTSFEGEILKNSLANVDSLIKAFKIRKWIDND